MAVEFKNGVIRNGGRCVGNVKNDVIREGSSSSPGSGKCVGNVKGGVVRRSSSSSAGSGSKVGKTRDYSIKGANYVDEAIVVACYHFLVRRVF